MAYFKLLWNCL